ncbi:GlsB/YeaQ/YmgE family stress response membrane protein [Bergeriella denitrificans]|uniref:Transglycosylase associated protein n=1 Tax=Bergeriella denitrificans TaxID=494 RepID=A0A378UJ68_BERDE|nr:GlsB/YeaQ/YmgE family stress response membrane protein [Bergeriella denitrificans]STZ77434.1 Transglycosylase associated protein [Bergeriella denitrificans]
MSWLGTIIVGFVVGVLAKILHPGNDNLGFIMTTLLGIAGAALAGFVGQSAGWYQVGQPAGWIASTIAAVVILAVYTRIVKKR